MSRKPFLVIFGFFWISEDGLVSSCLGGWKLGSDSRIKELCDYLPLLFSKLSSGARITDFNTKTPEVFFSWFCLISWIWSVLKKLFCPPSQTLVWYSTISLLRAFWPSNYFSCFSISYLNRAYKFFSHGIFFWAKASKIFIWLVLDLGKLKEPSLCIFLSTWEYLSILFCSDVSANYCFIPSIGFLTKN